MTNQERLDEAKRLLSSRNYQDRQKARNLLHDVKKQDKQKAVKQQVKLF